MCRVRPAFVCSQRAAIYLTVGGDGADAAGCFAHKGRFLQPESRAGGGSLCHPGNLIPREKLGALQAPGCPLHSVEGEYPCETVFLCLATQAPSFTWRVCFPLIGLDGSLASEGLTTPSAVGQDGHCEQKL